MQSARHNDGRDAKCVRPLSTTLMWAALLLAAAIISCKKDPEESQAPERSGDVFKADIAGKEWQADSLSVGSPKDSLLFITGLLRKDQYMMETFTLGFSGIAAPGEYAMVAQEKSESGKAGAVLMRGLPIEEAGIYKSVSGTVQVTHIDASGIRGTFAAQMQAGPGRTLTIDNGRFDIDFEAMIREQIKLLAGMWKGADYSRSWIASKEGVRGAVYHPKKRLWLINTSVLEFAADGTYQALYEKQQHRWHVERPGVLSMDGAMRNMIISAEYLYLAPPSGGETKVYKKIHELPGLE